MPVNTKAARAAHVVASSILGLDAQSVIIAGRVYIISPPTIRRLAAAAVYLAELDDRTPVATLQTLKPACQALSVFIHGDDSLTDELQDGTLQEVTDALKIAVTMLSPENFITLSASAKNVLRLTAKAKP